MDSRTTVLFLLSLGAAMVVLMALATADFSRFGEGLSSAGGRECVAVVHVENEITSDRTGFFTSESLSDSVRASIEEADSDPAVGSVLLMVNSPGGSAVASKEVFDEVRLAKKPVVAYLGEVAASGGYYVASAADYIVANPNSITGSIGARATLLNYAGLLEKLGLSEESIKTGELKDMGAGYRNATDEERALLLKLLQETKDNFVSDVEAGRKGKLDRAKFLAVLDARIVGAREAKEIGLVDAIGGRRDAEMKAAELGNVTVKPGESVKLCPLGERKGLDAFFSRLSSNFASELASEFKKPRLGVDYS